MGYIFETEIQQIMNASAPEIGGVRRRFGCGISWLLDLHPAIKAYFKARIRQLLQQGTDDRVRRRGFPYSLPRGLRLLEAGSMCCSSITTR